MQKVNKIYNIFFIFSGLQFSKISRLFSFTFSLFVNVFMACWLFFKVHVKKLLIHFCFILFLVFWGNVFGGVV